MGRSMYIVKGPRDDPPITNGTWIETEKDFMNCMTEKIKIIKRYDFGAILIYNDVLETFSLETKKSLVMFQLLQSKR